MVCPLHRATIITFHLAGRQATVSHLCLPIKTKPKRTIKTNCNLHTNTIEAAKGHKSTKTRRDICSHRVLFLVGFCIGLFVAVTVSFSVNKNCIRPVDVIHSDAWPAS